MFSVAYKGSQCAGGALNSMVAVARSGKEEPESGPSWSAGVVWDGKNERNRYKKKWLDVQSMVAGITERNPG